MKIPGQDEDKTILAAYILLALGLLELRQQRNYDCLGLELSPTRRTRSPPSRRPVGCNRRKIARIRAITSFGLNGQQHNHRHLIPAQ